jgi:hypothetical protein
MECFEGEMEPEIEGLMISCDGVWSVFLTEISLTSIFDLKVLLKRCQSVVKGNEVLSL